ncbi:hypothetical protein BD779DRAFT_1669066 [Infundibulicybe gibba]|nr:hypothetical protein BD779DRAFT_1669066 [Infundibulicybe gibba]
MPSGDTSNPQSPSSSSTKSLTPNRKHRKLLKDGSGAEVWPESVEKVFVQGLHDYWDSPWATYSQSRGRSRWRNQFLVDYLQARGITRSKKQVASHIQVLRNMWKGEPGTYLIHPRIHIIHMSVCPEFHLVAGGDELLEIGYPLQVKREDHTDITGLIPMGADERETEGSPPASPDYSPAETTSEFPPTPEQLVGSLYCNTYHNYPPPRFTESPMSALVPDIPAESKPLPRRTTIDNASCPPGIPPIFLWTRQPSTKVNVVSLSADGMNPLSIKLDALTPSEQTGHRRPPMALKIKLSIPPLNDTRSPSTLHGFTGNLYLSSVWMSSGKCTTKVFAGNVCISEEIGSLDVSTIQLGTVVAMLPESSLTRCRWLDASAQITLLQEINIDNELAVVIIYDLGRRNDYAMPSAELVGYQRCRIPPASASQPTPRTYSSPVEYRPLTDQISYPRWPTSTSLSCALTPAVNNFITAAPTSVSF